MKPTHYMLNVTHKPHNHCLPLTNNLILHWYWTYLMVMSPIDCYSVALQDKKKTLDTNNHFYYSQFCQCGVVAKYTRWQCCQLIIIKVSFKMQESIIYVMSHTNQINNCFYYSQSLQCFVVAKYTRWECCQLIVIKKT